MALPLATGGVAMRKTLGIMASYQWRFVGVLALQITAVLATLVAPWMLGQLVTRVSQGRATVTYIDTVVAVIVVVTILGAVINRYAQMHARTLGESVCSSLL